MKNLKVSILKQNLEIKTKLKNLDILSNKELETLIFKNTYDGFVYYTDNYFILDINRFKIINFFSCLLSGSFNNLLVKYFNDPNTHNIIQSLLTFHDFKNQESITLEELEQSSVYEFINNNEKQMYKILDTAYNVHSYFPEYFVKPILYNKEFFILEKLKLEPFVSTDTNLKNYNLMMKDIHEYMNNNGFGVNIYVRGAHLSIKNGRPFINGLPNFSSFPVFIKNALIENLDDNKVNLYLFDKDNIFEIDEEIKHFIVNDELKYFNINIIKKYS
jgi:hypothetical protein